MIRRLACIAAFALLLAGCSGGPVRRVSEPAASLQQITVRADGRWDVALRLNNFSSMPMRFDATALEIAFDNGSAVENPTFQVGSRTAFSKRLTA